MSSTNLPVRVKHYTIFERSCKSTKQIFEGIFSFKNDVDEETFREKVKEQYKFWLKDPVVVPKFC